jgi:putative addiction module killer protein
MRVHKPKALVIYRTVAGDEPFSRWLDSLQERIVRARIRARLDRVSLGNWGDHKAVGEGVIELREHYGPGYRLYCAQDGATVVLLLCGGSKSGQQTDIAKAHQLLADYRQRRKPHAKPKVPRQTHG